MFTQSTNYIEGSGVGVLDLFLISSMINESILESIFAGLLLIVPLIWLWYFRNALWRSVVIEQHQDLFQWFQSQEQAKSEIVLDEDRFWSRCMFHAVWMDKDVRIVWKAGFWWETCHVLYQGKEHSFEEGLSISHMQNILQPESLQQDDLQDDQQDDVI